MFTDFFKGILIGILVACVSGFLGYFLAGALLAGKGEKPILSMSEKLSPKDIDRVVSEIKKLYQERNVKIKPYPRDKVEYNFLDKQDSKIFREALDLPGLWGYEKYDATAGKYKIYILTSPASSYLPPVAVLAHEITHIFQSENDWVLEEISPRDIGMLVCFRLRDLCK